MKKENLITLQPKMAASVKVSNHFSWATVQKLYNSLPLEICPCESVADAKQYTKAIVVVLSAFILAGLYNTIMEGGAL